MSFNLFPEIENITPDEVKSILHGANAHQYQLVDVRQPNEYNAGHLPSAIFIPLGELPNRLDELDKAKKLIVYCRSGNRSLTASRFLKENGFLSVYNMSGGIKAWDGVVSIAPDSLPFDIKNIGNTLEDVLCWAISMEKGLNELYLILSERCTDQAVKKTLIFLASMEENHKERLFAVLEKLKPIDEVPIEREKKEKDGIMEGGGLARDYVERYGSLLNAVNEVLSLGMAIEAQAWDVYQRIAHEAKDDKAKQLLLELAKEEKAHLEHLGAMI